MSQKDVDKNESGFSWKTETDEALGTYIEKGKDKSGYASSIFSSRNDYTYPLKDDYKYDFPKDDGYIYSPSSYTSSHQSTSGIYSDMAYRNSKSEPNNLQKKQHPVSSNLRNESNLKKNSAKKQKSKKVEERKNSFSLKPSKKKKKAVKNKAASSKSNVQNIRKPKPNRPQAPERKNSAMRDLERERRENQRISKNNQRFDTYRTQGKSADESRRAQMKKKKQKGKLLAVISVCVLIVLVLCAIGTYVALEGAPIAKITVEGNETYKKKEILSVANISVGDNMLLVREKKTSSTLSEALPYISSVKVKYDFPDTLKLTVSETKDKYHLIFGKTFLTLDENGKVLSNKKKKVLDGCYKLTGFEKQDYNIGLNFVADEDNGNAEKLKMAKEIISAIEKSEVKNCKEISFEDLKCVTIYCGENISIYVDKKTDYERQFSLAKDAIEEKQKSETKAYFDLRYENMVVHN